MKIRTFTFEDPSNPYKTNLGYKRGQRMFNKFRKIVDLEGENVCWNIDVKGSMGTDYYFFSYFLGPIFNQFSKILPNNSVVAVTCYNTWDCRYLYTGIAFNEKEDISLLNIDEAFDSISKKNRYFLMINRTDPDNTEFVYVGTTEDTLLNLLRYLEENGKVTAEKIKLDLGWQMESTVTNINILLKRKLISKEVECAQDMQGEQTLYTSNAYLLKDGTNEN